MKPNPTDPHLTPPAIPSLVPPLKPETKAPPFVDPTRHNRGFDPAERAHHNQSHRGFDQGFARASRDHARGRHNG